MENTQNRPFFVVEGNYPKIAAGESVKLEDNAVNGEKSLVFTCKIGELGDGVIRVGHGKTAFNGFWVEIRKNTLEVHNYNINTRSDALTKTFEHGLEVKDIVMLCVTTEQTNIAHISMVTGTGHYEAADRVYWLGRNGEIFAEAEGIDLYDAKISWTCKDYAHEIWLCGDSYCNFNDVNRWPTHLRTSGFANILMMSYSGMASKAGLMNLQNALKHGTPKYLVWCMGMNDPDAWSADQNDPELALNKNWIESIEEVSSICRHRGIELILSKIPNVPGTEHDYARNHRLKNDWIEKSGYRYIDFPAAVGQKGPYDFSWAEGTIGPDGTHPTEFGARALFMQAILDFPEFRFCK